MNEKGGYIAISRKLFQHELYTEKREYSRFEAWVDLIQLCAFEDNNSMLFKGRVVKWERGQTIASVRYLQQRWNWKSVDKVFCFLELLRNQEMIQTDKEQGIGRITLCKYDDYNPKPNRNRNTDRTPTEHRPNNIKEYNKEELIKVREVRAQDFYSSLVSYVGKYSKEMVRAFYDYWSEWNKSGTKMKWELKETWEVSKRLATWNKRENDFGGSKAVAKQVPPKHPKPQDQVMKSIGL
jgi:hypothetical protein